MDTKMVDDILKKSYTEAMGRYFVRGICKRNFNCLTM
jgi:hypothetical protein